jgi:acyl-homoserine-lactone acylase
MHRGSTVLPFGGGPDVLYAVYGNVDEKTGKVIGWGGEGYVAIVEWSPEGKMSAQTLHHYGSAISKPDSPHYADQAHLFQQRKMKPALFTRAEVEANLKVAYRPGEAWEPGGETAIAQEK